MADPSNSTCSLSFATRPVTEALRLYSLIFTIISLTTLVGSLALWLVYRKHAYLKRRSLSLLFILAAGYVMQVLAGPIRRYLEGDLPCELMSSVFFLCLPYVGWPGAVRLMLWVNKIRFNYVLAKDIALSGAAEVHTSDPKLRRPRFLASRRFGMTLATVFLLPYTAAIIVLVNLYTCRLCDGLTDLAYYIFLLVFAVVILSVIACLYYTKDVPDLFGIRRESKYAFGLGSLIGIPGLVLSNYDVGGFEMDNPLIFTWGLAVDIGFFLFIFVTFPLQLYYARQISKGRFQEKSALQKILSNERGYRFFQLYLATELSLENLLFYSAVDEWKKKCLDQDDDTDAIARSLFKTYFTRGNILEVNVSSTAADRLRAEFATRNSSFPLTIFDETQEEVFKLMAGSSFSNFKASVFYQLYNGELESDEVTWIRSSGMSSFVFMSESGLEATRAAGSTVRREEVLRIEQKVAKDSV